MCNSSFLRKFNFLFLLGIFLISACSKEGCSDKKALNYDVTVTKDDGSCRYCEVAETGRGMTTFSIIDTRVGSPQEGNAVIRLEVNRREARYNDGNCGISSCIVSLKVINLTSKNIEALRFGFNMVLTNGQSFGLSQQQFVSLTPNGELLLEDLISQPLGAFGTCPDITGATLSFSSIFSAVYN